MISITIPTYRNYDTLIRCLQSVHEHTSGDYELIVIDNGSKARGYVWAANRCLETAKGDPIVVMNDDIVVHKNWLPPLLKELKKDNVWISSPNLDSIGPCLVWTRQAYEALNGFNDKYIHWGADGDLEERLIEMGKAVSTVKESHVEHLRRSDSYTNIALLREWHLHDFGHYPESW